MISVLQASLVRQPAVRKKLGIPEFKRHRKTGKSQKGFVQSVREGMEYYIFILKIDFHDYFTDCCSH